MTDFRYCILIPHYRHDRELAEYLPRLAHVGLPALVVDDGSDPDTRFRLRRLVSGHPWASLIQRERNGGKGAAIIDGLKTLARNGYTHAISVDADGQHDSADVTRVHEASQRDPQAIYSGRPVFGDDIPRFRLHGRKITNLLARIEADRKEIEDAMCGFRLYPLATILPLCDAIGSRRRMEFDTEILVRAAWAGLPLRFFPTRVIYPQGGRSHFRMISDNIRLSLMHATLLFHRFLRVLLSTRSNRNV